MQYAVLFYENEADFAARTDEKRQGEYWAAWAAYIQALTEAGVMAGGAGLQPPHSATTLRLRGGERHVQDGPYADTKEQLAGNVVLNVPDLDTALEWAARCPAASTGAVEVRPVLPMQS